MLTHGFSHYNLRAPRALLEELRAFYCDIVGLRVGDLPPFTRLGYWLYAGNHPILHLSECAPGERTSQSGPGTFDHAAFDCSGRSEFEDTLRRHGVAYETAHVAQTGRVQLFFSDPAGNGVELNFARSDS
jgi:catechol-2,3-dioxygenase